MLAFARVACTSCLRNMLLKWLCELLARVACMMSSCALCDHASTHTHTLTQQRTCVHACVRTHVHTWTCSQRGGHTADWRARALCEPCVSPAQPNPASCLRELLVRVACARSCARCLRKPLARASSFARDACARACAR